MPGDCDVALSGSLRFWRVLLRRLVLSSFGVSGGGRPAVPRTFSGVLIGLNPLKLIAVCVGTVLLLLRWVVAMDDLVFPSKKLSPP